MKKIVVIFAAMAAVLSSCQKSELESVSANEIKDIVLNISVSNPGADDTKALVKTDWVEGDQIKIWFDDHTGDTPDLVIKCVGSENWEQVVGSLASTPKSDGNIKAVYNNFVIVASTDGYTYTDNTLSFHIDNWKFLTEIQVVVKGLDYDVNEPYTLSCDKFTPLDKTGFKVTDAGIESVVKTKGSPAVGQANADGVAFVFATAEYSSSDADFKFTLKNLINEDFGTRKYTATTDKIRGTTGSMTTIKALTIESSKFAVPAATTGTAKATIGGSEVDVKWVQLWAGGPKFAEKNVGASSAAGLGSNKTYAEAAMTGKDYVWGANWCTPSKNQMDELLKAATSTGSEKVKCEYTQLGSTYGFKFTGKETGYDGNSVFFPAQYGTTPWYAYYWSSTADSGASYMYLSYSSKKWYSSWKNDGKVGDAYLVRPVLAN